MLSKETKIRVLENFYAIDYVLFGKPITKIETCCPLVKEEYLSIKGAFLSVFIEMAKLIEHTPPLLQEKINSLGLRSLAKKSAKVSRENAMKIVTSPKAKNDIKIELKESLSREKNVDIAQLVEEKIREKSFSLALDNLMVARLLSESKNINKLNEWEGKIIEDSYKILRDNLVESAIQIIYSDEYIEEQEIDNDIRQRINELHSPEFLQEVFEYIGFLNIVGDSIMTTFRKCLATKCHKSAGVKMFTRKKGICRELCWGESIQSGINTLKSGKSRCKTARSPERCMARFDKMIARYEKSLKKSKDKAAKKIAKAKEAAKK